MSKNRITIATLASFLFAVGFSATANAQYLISTRAGFVNRADGKVFILRADSVDGEKGRASLGTQMRDGDTISTTENSFAEILMNPGSYIRVSENSELRAVNTDFNAVRFELIKGSAIAEVGQIEKKAPMEVITAHGTLTITTDGLYRVDEKGSATLVSVRQGEIYIGTISDVAANKALKVGHGKVVTLTGATLDKSDIAKIDKDTADNFDQWSFSRAQTLTAANISTLRRSQTMTAFTGGWYYNPFFNCYTFMPFGSRYYSPYGFGFFNNYGAAYYYNPYGYGYGGYYGGGGGISHNAPARAIAGNDRGQIRRTTDARSVDTGSSLGSQRGGHGDSGGFRSTSSSSSTVTSSPSVISAPAPSRSESSGGGAMPSRGRP
jgi:hypothetical protein